MCCACAVHVLALPVQRPHGYIHTHELLLTHLRTLGGTLALAATALLAASAAALALTQNSRTARLACSQVKWADHAYPDY